LIFDEAHNVESNAEESGSFSISKNELIDAEKELNKLKKKIEKYKKKEKKENIIRFNSSTHDVDFALSLMK